MLRMVRSETRVTCPAGHPSRGGVQLSLRRY